ncbi:hypothetical protein [Planctomycetes bacterium TBK1r]|uniref:Uncharacterized protein n=1 Tax=Stieleria magnilauensis TaxID=2527963 RepID=A0ABX5XV30_9BACT|nr:hypothetical protein TBK1r_49070 [Planctomycetes bacterium TBK1r]
MTRLTRSDLITWADTKAAEGLFPELIRRLVVASNQTVEVIVMPYGDSVGRSGLDGYVLAKNGSKYVPEGESVWEFGTNKDHVSKANSDFKKRTTGTATCRQQELTYLCGTPRHWEKKTEWESDPGPVKDKVVGHWKAVRVFDVDDILGWLSDCPGVEAWFSRKLGKATAGLRDVEGYWANVATTDAGLLSPQVLLAGREELASKVQAHFAGEEKRSALAIPCRSPAEVVPFAVASVGESGDEVSIARTVVVDSRIRWEQLIVEESDLGLIVAPQVQPSREQLQQAANRNHRVVYCSATGDTELPRLSEFEVRKALTSSGIGEAEATQHAKQCGGNGQLLLDRLSGLHAPAGSVGSSLDDRVKAACLLVVGWNGNHPADREVFTILSGLPYEEIETSLVADSNDPDGLLFRADGKFRLLSPELAWIRYASLITKSVVDDFADVVRYLLADDDPTAGMSGDERLTAQFLGQRPEFSGTLRRNVVHSLAIAGSIGATRLKLDHSMSPSFVDWIVRSTLKDAGFSRWASFRGELSILAEAAPDALLDALENDLHANGPLAEVMDKTETGLFCSPAHTGILWALERLCWSPQHLERATSVLLRLAGLNADINSGNNPSNSIRETLQLYCPQTNADWEARRTAIDRMLKEDAGTAFRLVISLFPSGHSSWMCRELPTWRNWAHGYKSGTTYGQIATELRWCVEQLLAVAGDDAERWCALIELCGDIEDEQYTAVLESYESALARGAFEQDGRRLLWETINAMLVRMEWSASRRRLSNGEIVDKDDIKDPDADSEPHFPREVKSYETHGPRLRHLLDASTPDDPVLAGCHAFLHGLNPNHCTRHFSDRFNYKKQQERINEARQSIAESVWKVEGLDGLRRLTAIEHVDADGVGRTAALNETVKIELDEVLPLFSSETKADRMLASGFATVWAWQRKDSLSTDVLPLLSTMSSDETISSYLRCLPLVPEVWDCIDQQSEAVQRLYWKNASVPWEIPEGRLSYFVRGLVQVARADRGIDLLARCREDIAEDEVDLVFEALEMLPLVERDADEPRQDSLRWELQELFEVLYRIGMSQVERLLRLELLYHQVFEDDESRKFQPKGLLVAIRDTPSLFVDLLRYPWKNDAGKSTTPDDDPTKALANQVGGLLRQLAELPGQSELCPMNEKSIADWVTEVVQIASECRYLTALGLQLPDVITSGAWTSIDTWPTPDVADVINILAEAIPETFPRHLSVSLSNARGVHIVDPTGQSEKSQAEQLRNRADQLRETCPAASRALGDLAQSLDSEARRNVERAKWER